MAFQIQDDLIDLLASPEVSGKDRASDIREGKKTLIHLKAREKGFDLSPYRRDLTNQEIDAIIARLTELGVIEEVKAVSRGLVEEGARRIGVLPPSPEKDLLLAMAEHFITRRF